MSKRPQDTSAEEPDGGNPHIRLRGGPRPDNRSGLLNKATWHGQVIAESDQTIELDGYHYFPPASVRMDESNELFGLDQAVEQTDAAGQRVGRGESGGNHGQSSSLESDAGTALCK